MVRAHPSTAMSCVAAKKLRRKNTQVMMVTLGAESIPSPNRSLTLRESISINTPEKTWYTTIPGALTPLYLKMC